MRLGPCASGESIVTYIGCDYGPCARSAQARRAATSALLPLCAPPFVMKGGAVFAGPEIIDRMWRYAWLFALVACGSDSGGDSGGNKDAPNAPDDAAVIVDAPGTGVDASF